MLLKYFMMHFTSIQCGGTSCKHEHVHCNYRKHNINLCIHHCIYELPLPSISPYTFLNSSSRSLNNVEFTLDGVLIGLHSSMFKCLTTSSVYLLWLITMVSTFLFLSNLALRQQYNSPRSLVSNSLSSSDLNHFNLGT